MFDTIVYLERVNNNKFCSNFALLALNFEDFFYIFIVIVYANTSAFIVFIFKFVNIAFERNKKMDFIFISKIFYLQTFNFVIQSNANVTNIIKSIYEHKFYNFDVNKIVFLVIKFNNNSIKYRFDFYANAKDV